MKLLRKYAKNIGKHWTGASHWIGVISFLQLKYIIISLQERRNMKLPRSDFIAHTKLEDSIGGKGGVLMSMRRCARVCENWTTARGKGDAFTCYANSLHRFLDTACTKQTWLARSTAYSENSVRRSHFFKRSPPASCVAL